MADCDDLSIFVKTGKNQITISKAKNPSCDNNYLRPTGKGRKLLGRDPGMKTAEDADAAEFDDMPMVSPGGIELGPNCLWATPGGKEWCS